MDGMQDIVNLLCFLVFASGLRFGFEFMGEIFK